MGPEKEDSTTVTGPTTDPERTRTVSDLGAPTTPEMPAIPAGPKTDEEATRVDPAPAPRKLITGKPGPPVPDDDEDSEATKHTGTPKKAREAQRILEESRRLNAAGGPKQPAKKLHPLVPIGVAFAILAAVLLALNWLVRSPSVDAQGGKPSSGVRSLFDW